MKKLENSWDKNMNNVWKRISILKDSFLYFSQEQKIRRHFLSTVFFIAVSLILLMLFYLCFNCPPEIFGKIFQTVFISSAYTDKFVRDFCIFAMSALSFGFAMKNGIFNIGISGQMLGGATVSFLIISSFQENYHPLGGQFLTLFFAITISMLISLLIGALKIYLKIHEVLSGILLNWIVLLISATLVKEYMFDEMAWNAGTLSSIPLHENFGLSQNGDYGWVWSLCLTLFSFAIVFVILKYTVFGHKIKTVGFSPLAATYYGYNTNALNLASFAISGVLAGILGLIVYAGSNNRVIDFNGTGIENVPQEGFNGIAISMIAYNNPIGILLVSLFFGVFSIGADVYISEAVQNLAFSLLMYLVAICAILNFFKPSLWFSKTINHLDSINKYKNFQTSLETICWNFQIKKSINRNLIAEEKINSKIRQKKSNIFIRFIYTIWYSIACVFDCKQKEFVNDLINQYFDDKNKLKKDFKRNCVNNVVKNWENFLLSKHKPKKWKLRWELQFVKKTISKYKLIFDNGVNKKIHELENMLLKKC